MDGHARQLIEFLDGAKNRFIIPVYQRNYDWSTKQCKQLFDDLVQVIATDRKSHFFGSIVSTHAKNGAKSDYLIIDGQQRITTISILYIAMINLLKSNIIKSDNETLVNEIEETYIIDKFRKDERKLRLKPIKDDCIAFDKLVINDGNDFIEESNITVNYFYFYNRIQRNEISINQLYDAISRLEIIDIFVDEDENPQLIFESLNSTGLDLTEADKIRNFILMGLDSQIQETYYENYWNKIEKLTSYNVSDFIRHYLTVKQKKIPNVNAVYFTFKEYVIKNFHGKKEENYELILKDMLRFALIYHNISTATKLPNEIINILKRLNRIDVSVAYPFFLPLFSHFEEGIISENEVLNTLKCIESFVFRRLMCPGYPTNSLNKIFCTIDFDVMKIKKPTDSYDSVLIYILEHKSGSAGFPTDLDFKQSLQTRDVYHMQKKNKEYIFDRLENQDSVEHVNVIELMENQILSIEHIMPQTLTEQWKKALGDNWEEIFDTRLHTLQNLTLTGYNAKYQNKLFIEKKNCEKGFRDSGLNLNKNLLDYDNWTSKEMDLRYNWLETLSLKLWAYPKTDFIPQEELLDEVTLEDADDLTGKNLVSFTYGDSDSHKTRKWVDMFTNVVQQLYSEDYAPIHRLANTENFSDIQFFKEEKNSDWFKIAPELYLFKANSTSSKMRVLNRLFEEYNKDKSELVFRLESQLLETE